MTITQQQIAAMVKRLRDMAIHLPLSKAAMLKAADMLEQLAAECNALDEACITWSEVSQRNYQRAKAAEAEVARLVDEKEFQRKIISDVAGALSAWPRALQEKHHD